jgi:hypothetical protein
MRVEKDKSEITNREGDKKKSVCDRKKERKNMVREEVRKTTRGG